MRLPVHLERGHLGEDLATRLATHHLRGLEKTRFFFKHSPVGFFVFLGFLGFFVFFIYSLKRERVFRVFSVSRLLLGASRL